MIKNEEKSINKSDLRIVFMGTPEFAKTSLETLINNKYNIVATFCQPDKQKGRGMKFMKPPVKELAQQYNIPVFQPVKIRNNNEIFEKLKELKPDLIIVVAYGKILPKEIIELPKYGCINVHGSLLPKYRGAAPIQWAIINGETTTGITTMMMDEGMDTGDMLLKESINIDETDTYEILYNKLKLIGANLLISTLEMLCKDFNNFKREKQEGDFTIAPIITKEISKIDFSNTSKTICNLIRGLNPSPACYMVAENGRHYKVFFGKTLTKEEMLDKYNINVSEKPGTVVVSNSKQGLIITTKDSYIEIIELQEQNAKRMLAKEYLKGKKIELNSLFI